MRRYYKNNTEHVVYIYPQRKDAEGLCEKSLDVFKDHILVKSSDLYAKEYIKLRDVNIKQVRVVKDNNKTYYIHEN